MRRIVVGLPFFALVGLFATWASLAAEPEGVARSEETDPYRVTAGFFTEPIRDVKVPADLPATEGGVLAKFLVKEGDEIKAGDVLAQIDDRQAKFSREAALQRKLGAEKEAGNKISVDYAQAKNWVAQAAYKKSLDANRRVPGVVPEIELEKQQLEVVSSKLETDHAEYQLKIAAFNVDVRGAELKLADLDVQRREIRSPINGVVVRRFQQEGEWVRAGDPLVQVVQLDRLKIEITLDKHRLAPSDVDKQPVNVVVTLRNGQDATFPGQVTWASPMLTNNGLPARIEVTNRKQNGYWVLLEGMSTKELIIERKK